MKIKWLAHAAFLIESDGLRIVTDPYKPDVMGFAEIRETANVVIRSSAEDEGHCFAEPIAGNPEIVTATDIPEGGVTVGSLTIAAIPSQESLIHKEAPRDNAMYRFTLEGLHIAHFGDVGNRLTKAQVAAFAGTDVALVPTGGPPTIDLEDLWFALDEIRPRVVIPMHYGIPDCKVRLLPVTDFTDHYSPSTITWVDGPEIELNGTQPDAMRIIVLQPSTAHVESDLSGQPE
jgi:L-ascorbate metabolism protein UlaG (beta-lactamase superfamily)